MKQRRIYNPWNFIWARVVTEAVWPYGPSFLQGSKKLTRVLSPQGWTVLSVYFLTAGDKMQWDTPIAFITFSLNLCPSQIWGPFFSQNGLAFLPVSPSSYSCSLFFIWTVTLSLPRISITVLIVVYYKHFQNFMVTVLLIFNSRICDNV